MGTKINTDNVVISPITIEVLIISGNFAQPPLGSINMPVVDPAKNVIPIRRAPNMNDNRWLIPANRIISHKPIAKVPSGINKKAPHCKSINKNEFIVSPIILWGKIMNQEIIVKINGKYFRNTV